MRDQLKIDSVFLEFGEKKVLRGATLNWMTNQVKGILGRNGSGKSCFLKIVTGQIIPQFKYISYNEVQIEHVYKSKGLINYLPQHEFHPKSVRVNKLLDFYEIDKNQFIKNYTFIGDQIEKKFSELSGGTRRLLEVLLVLEADSKFTILDEPFSHIMPIHIDLVKESIQKMKKRKGILVTDHQYKNVLEISDELHLLKDGKFVKINHYGLKIHRF
jgi:lipopolysaccharide export system ATP-binding protein